MSTKSKARAARRHPEPEPAPTSLRVENLPPEQQKAVGEIAGAVLGLVTLGALQNEPLSTR